MLVERVALIFDDRVRPDTTGRYCLRALRQLVSVEHLLPDALSGVAVDEFDLFFYVDDGLEYDFAAELRPAAFWAIDTHLELERALRRSGAVDVVFAAQKDGARRLTESGAPCAGWLPLACDPLVHRPHEVEKRHDLCFIGHDFPGPRRELLAVLRERFPDMLVDRRFFDEMARAHSASRVVFNRSVRDDVNMRVFEALACGSVLVTNDLAHNGLDELFRDGAHLVTYRDGRNLIEAVERLLLDPDRRQQLAAAGLAEVRAHHTYRHRMAAVLDVVEGVTPIAETLSPILGSTARYRGLARPEARARRIEVELNRGAHRVLATDRDLDVVAGEVRFDRILATGLAQVEDPIAYLRRCEGLLTDGGRLVACLPNARRRVTIAQLLRGYWPHGLTSCFTRREIEKLMFRAGWDIESIHLQSTPELEAWRDAGCPETFGDDGLQLRGMPARDLEELYTDAFCVVARPQRRLRPALTSIVIVCFNQLEYTRRAVESIRELTDEPYELVFVDNGSSDGTSDYLRSIEGARVLENDTNRGFPAAANQGIEASSGQQVLLLNNDVVVTTGWLRRMLDALASDPRIGLVGPCSNEVSGPQRVDVSYSHLGALDGFAWDWATAHAGVRRDVDRLVGFCLLLRRSVIDDIGKLDERFGVGTWEDDDFCRRALDAGYRAVIAVDAFVHHYGSRTFFGSGVDLAGLLEENRELYDRKWLPSQRTPGTFSLREADGGGLLLEPADLELSLCMIVRDNEDTLEAALSTARPWVDEIVVVDTGSRDRTPRIAAAHGARVFHFPWCDDFSAARNESLRHARGRWLFWMDSDDTLPETCGAEMRRAIRAQRDPDVLGLVMHVHCPGEDATSFTVVDHVKIVRNHPDIRFEGRIHEQVLASIRRAGGEVAWTDAHVVHSGADNTPEGRAHKLQRDMRLLELELAERPDHPFVLFNLGMTLVHASDHRSAVGVLERCVAVSEVSESHVRKAIALLAEALQHVGDVDAAEERCRSGLRLFPADTELMFRLGILAMERRDWDAAVGAFQQLVEEPEKERYFASLDSGLRSHKALVNLAICWEEAGDTDRAAACWRRCLDQAPDYAVAWEGLVSLRRRRQDFATLEAEIDERGARPALHGVSCAARAILLEARGDVDGAIEQLDRAIAESPTCELAHRELSRLLFETGRDDRAQLALRALAELAPNDAAVWHNLGQVLLRTGRPAAAVPCLRNSLARRPDDVPTLRSLARACKGSGQPADAATAWRRVVALCSTDAEALAELAEAGLEAGRE